MSAADLSVVMPAYNTEEYAGEAIASVLAGADRLLELIVVDDGSTDATAAIAASFGDPVRVIRQENRGAAGARNTALAAARGTYLGFLDSDDIWVAGRPDPRLELLDANPEVAGVGGSCRFFVAGAYGSRTIVLDPMTAAEMGAVILRRTVLDTVPGFDEQFAIAEDVDFLARIGEAGLRIDTIDTLTFLDRLRPGSLTRDRDAVLKGWLQAGRMAMKRAREREADAG